MGKKINKRQNRVVFKSDEDEQDSAADAPPTTEKTMKFSEPIPMDSDPGSNSELGSGDDYGSGSGQSGSDAGDDSDSGASDRSGASMYSGEECVSVDLGDK